MPGEWPYAESNTIVSFASNVSPNSNVTLVMGTVTSEQTAVIVVWGYLKTGTAAAGWTVSSVSGSTSAPNYGTESRQAWLVSKPGTGASETFTCDTGQLGDPQAFGWTALGVVAKTSTTPTASFYAGATSSDPATVSSHSVTAATNAELAFAFGATSAGNLSESPAVADLYLIGSQDGYPTGVFQKTPAGRLYAQRASGGTAGPYTIDSSSDDMAGVVVVDLALRFAGWEINRVGMG